MDMMFSLMALCVSTVGAVWIHRHTSSSPRVKPTLRSVASPLYREAVHEGGTPAILVVDNNPDIRRCLHLILAPLYTVFEAESAEQALHLAAGHRLALVLTDAEMKPMDGLMLCRALKARTPVPVVVMTADYCPGLRCQVLDAGADAYLTKPFDLLAVRRLVGELIG